MKIKSLLSVITAIMLILCSAPGTTAISAGEVTPRGEIYNGVCGDDLTWTLDTGTGVLEITGNGAIKDYYYDDDAP